MAPPTDQPWLDVSIAARAPRDPEWWPDVAPTPPDIGSDPPDPPPAVPADVADGDDAGDAPRALLGTPLPAAEPWWRRRLDGVLDRWLPERAAERPRWRLAVAATVGAVLLGIAVAVGLVMSGRTNEPEVPPALPAAAVSQVLAPSTTPPDAGGSIVISVVGRVATPGLVTLQGGARVADALKAAGGPAPGANLGGLNLARRLTDGEQIYVGIPTPPNAEPPGAASGTGQPGAERVDLNSASPTSLDTLPGVGPVTAQRIVDWRTEHGRFSSVEQLREIDGIGPSRFAKLKDLVVAQ